MANLRSDTRPIFECEFVDQDDAPINLDGFNITLRYKIGKGSVVEKTAIQTVAGGNKATYQAADDELTPGAMVREWILKDTGNKDHGPFEKFHSHIRGPIT